MRGIALFSQWPDHWLRQLVGRMVPREFKRYDLLYRRGQPADAFFVVVSGSVHLYLDEWRASTSGAAGATPGAPSWQKKVVDPMTGKSLGADISVYEDATLGPGDVLGVEALAMTERAQPPGIGIARAHTATTAASCMLLVLSTPLLAIGAVGARISQQLVEYGTRRRAQLTVIHQALCRAPVFSAIDLRRLMRVAPLFEVQTYATGERIFEEGTPQAFFYVIVAGRAALSQRIGWSKLAPFGRVGGSVVDQLASLVQTEQRLQSVSERVVQSVAHDADMPSLGEAALLGAGSAHSSRPSTSAEPPVARASARAVDACTLLCLSRAHVDAFYRELPEFGELVQQRRHQLTHMSLHAVALQQAIERGSSEDEGRQEALLLLKQPPDTKGRALKPNWTPKPLAPPHPHLAMTKPTLKERAKVANQARRIMLSGMEVHQVACQMGLVGEEPR